MSTAKFFTDEDVFAAVAPALRNDGIDAISTSETGRLGESDESQLVWAASHDRVLVTFNVAHFAALHTSWLKSNQHHVSAAVSNQCPIGDLLRRVRHFAKTLDGEAMGDRLEFLSDW